MAQISTSREAPGFQKNADYVLDIVRSGSLHQLIYNEAIIAASQNALIVHEQNLRDVVYIPKTDIVVPLTRMEGQSSYCPFKGTASYWSLEANGQTCEKVGWSYEDPFTDVAPIEGYIAFYLNKIDCYWRNGIEQPTLGPGCCEEPCKLAMQAA